MAETLSTLSIVSFVAAAFFLALSIFLWFFFGIPSVVGDLNGRNARKSIARMRASNEKRSTKGNKAAGINTPHIKASAPMPASVKSGKRQEKTDDNPETGLLDENAAQNFRSEATGLLYDDKTQVLPDEDETIILSDASNTHPKRIGGKKLIMIEEVMLIHTMEVIE